MDRSNGPPHRRVRKNTLTDRLARHHAIGLRLHPSSDGGPLPDGRRDVTISNNTVADRRLFAHAVQTPGAAMRIAGDAELTNFPSPPARSRAAAAGRRGEHLVRRYRVELLPR